MRLLDFAASTAWCLMPEMAPELAAIAEREHQTNPEILEAYRAKGLERAERARRRGDVAILNATGVMMKYGNIFAEISGATSYQILRRDLQTALDDQSISSILIVVDSPGGEANGCDELAAAIYAGRDRKPITAFVSGMAASGGYWLASAASRVVVSDMAMLGSIGVVMGIEDRSAADERRGVRTIEFVSSQSPGKRPDPDTEEGRSRVQSMVDGLADVFISAVAKHRGVTADTVVKRFGGGGILIGAAAVKAGMADEVGQLEATISSMQGRRSVGLQPPRVTAPPTPARVADPQPAQVSDADKIKTILQSENSKQMPALASALAFDVDLPLAACSAILAAGRRAYERCQADAVKPAPDFAAFKRGAGTLGVDDGVTTDTGRTGWAQATAAANGRVTT